MEDFKLTKKFVDTIVRYDPDTGNLYWIERRCGRSIHNPAGHYHKAGRHIQITIAGIQKPAHHIIYLIKTGEFPPYLYEIKHLDGDRTNNKWGNLKLQKHTANRPFLLNGGK